MIWRLRQPAISRVFLEQTVDIQIYICHLTILRQAGLIDDRKAGKYIYYELNTTVFQEVLSWLQTLMEEEDNEKDK